jgi:hypothetical protein
MTSLVDILKKKVTPGDVPSPERKRMLAIELSRMEIQQATSAYSIIRSYKLNKDTVRRVGDSESAIPYYGIETAEGIEMSLSRMPDELILILEQLVKAIN